MIKTTEEHTFILTPMKGMDGNPVKPVKMERGTLALGHHEHSGRQAAIITNRSGVQMVLDHDALLGLAELINHLQVQGKLK